MGMGIDDQYATMKILLADDDATQMLALGDISPALDEHVAHLAMVLGKAD